MQSLICILRLNASQFSITYPMVLVDLGGEKKDRIDRGPPCGGAVVFLFCPKIIAKARGCVTDLLVLENMKILVSQMADLKLRLLERVVQARHSPQIVDTLSSERLESHKMTVCQAVEDRISKRIDLASRTDLTDRQAMDAIRLLLKIVRKCALPIHFSPAEFFLLARGTEIRYSICQRDGRLNSTR